MIDGVRLVFVVLILAWVLGITVSVFINDGDFKRGCEFGENFKGEIVERLKVTETRADYVILTEKNCKILVYASRWPLYEVGSVVEVSGEVQSVGDISEEYEGYAKYLIRRDIGGTVRFGDVSPLPVTTAGRLSKERVTSSIKKIFPEPAGSFVMAILLAERGMLDADIQENFRNTGVAHVLAISGLHISLLAGMLVYLLMLVPIGAAWRNAIAIFLLWVYVFFVGMPTSAVRAGWFWTLALLFWQQAWLTSLPTVLLLTIVTMVSADPLIITDVGFQLSISAVAGIGLALLLVKPRKAWLALVVVSTGASLGTWPIVAYHFGVVSFVSVIANVLVVPLVPTVMILSLLALVLSFLLPVLGLVLGWLVYGVFYWMIWVTGILAQVPGSYLEDFEISGWLIGVYYLIMILVVILILKVQKRSWREIWD